MTTVKNPDTYGTPYTIGEARLAAKDVQNIYHRELMEWLIADLEAARSRIAQIEAGIKTAIGAMTHTTDCTYRDRGKRSEARPCTCEIAALGKLVSESRADPGTST